MPHQVQSTPSEPRVWITSFWGFDPENEGYLGFTYEGNRDWFLEHWREGDLILIYGANAEMTAPEKRHQALGFLEIEPTLIRDTDRMSEAGYHRKQENNWLDRWTFAFPVIRAAHVTRRISIDHVATRTLVPSQARIIASRGALLTPEETKVALSLPVSRANVFGMPPLAEEALATTFTPSRGLDPTFGTFEVTRTDSEHFLYALLFDCEPCRVLNRRPFEIGRRVIVKVGYSNDPARRCTDHNDCLPPAAQLKWKLTYQSRGFESGNAAKAAEDILKTDLAMSGESLGREFFLCTKEELSSAFARATQSTAQVVIRA